MVGTIKDPTLFLLLSSVGILLFGSIGYGIYTTVGPSSYKLRDTIKEHARMHELGIMIMVTIITTIMKQNIFEKYKCIYIFFNSELTMNSSLLQSFWSIIIILYFSNKN